jgi:hypothetical protein
MGFLGETMRRLIFVVAGAVAVLAIAAVVLGTNARADILPQNGSISFFEDQGNLELDLSGSFPARSPLD